MSQIILRNNIRWDWALIKQVQHYKRDGTVPKLANRNFKDIASAVSLETSGKIMFTNKGVIYEIVPYEDIGEQLDSIMADPALAVCGRKESQESAGGAWSVPQRAYPKGAPE